MGGKLITALVAGTCALLFALPALASAATITPNTTADELNAGGACSLREAISAANGDAAIGGCPGGSGSDTIVLTGGSTYGRSLTGANEDANGSGDLDIRNDPLTIQVAGPGGAIIEGTGAPSGGRVIQILDSVAEWGFNDPIYVQYVKTMEKTFTCDLFSYTTQIDVVIAPFATEVARLDR